VGYTAAKSALQSLTKSLALEYGPKGIRFNLVSPGMTDTSLIADVPEKAKLLVTMQTPLRRLAKPQDVAQAIAFLLSDESSYISGETLRVCGGQIML
jgi:3-oxoacyl-[acyl-carrier protein] reductase